MNVNYLYLALGARHQGKTSFWTNKDDYIFDTMHYLIWTQKWGLNKNSQRVLQLFKARCDYEATLKKIKGGDAI